MKAVKENSIRQVVPGQASTAVRRKFHKQIQRITRNSTTAIGSARTPLGMVIAARSNSNSRLPSVCNSQLANQTVDQTSNIIDGLSARLVWLKGKYGQQRKQTALLRSDNIKIHREVAQLKVLIQCNRKEGRQQQNRTTEECGDRQDIRQQFEQMLLRSEEAQMNTKVLAGMKSNLEEAVVYHRKKLIELTEQGQKRKLIAKDSTLQDRRWELEVGSLAKLKKQFRQETMAQHKFMRKQQKIRGQALRSTLTAAQASNFSWKSGCSTSQQHRLRYAHLMLRAILKSKCDRMREQNMTKEHCYGLVRGYMGNGFTTDISGGYTSGSTYCVLLNKVRMLEGIVKDKELQISTRKAILTQLQSESLTIGQPQKQLFIAPKRIAQSISKDRILMLCGWAQQKLQAVLELSRQYTGVQGDLSQRVISFLRKLIHQCCELSNTPLPPEPTPNTSAFRAHKPSLVKVEYKFIGSSQASIDFQEQINLQSSSLWCSQ